MTDVQERQERHHRLRQKDLPKLHPDWIDGHAVGIVKALQKAGHDSYLVGGCVRDLLLGLHPKDFDIATMAHPPQVKRLIHMAFIIGKRFRLVLVKRGEQQFEVATFRKELNPNDFPTEQFPNGPPPGDNIFGTPEEDAKRRDFTVNALFYDPISGEVIDFVDGLKDIESRVLRMIGEPNIRLVEDPIRILRALRFAHKLGFTIEHELRASMARHAGELKRSVLPRRREELLKLLRLEDPCAVLVECQDLGVLEAVFPTLATVFAETERLQTFLTLLESLRPSVVDPSNPTQLFAWLIDAWVETHHEHGISIDDERLTVFMRDELGMYKFEQSAVADAMRTMKMLERTADVRRRGERRQNGLIRREGFILALRLAIADHRLSGEDQLFWIDLYERARGEIEAEQSENRAKRGNRRRRPRRERGSGSGEKSRGDESSDVDAETEHSIDEDVKHEPPESSRA